MHNYGIPVIEPTVDFTKVPPIHQKRTITFVNHFIIHTVTFLNKFALCCEEKLLDFENKLQRVEASLEILESRLSSLPGTHSPAKTESSVQSDSSNQRERGEDFKSEVPDVAIDTEIEPSGEAIENNSKPPVIRDPRYEKYFKMLQFGVPQQAVKLKIIQEGLDPLILDNPDRTVPTIQGSGVMEANMTTDDEDG